MQTSTEVRGLCEEWRRELEQLLLELNRYRHNERMLKYTTIIKLVTNRRTNVTQRATFSNWTHLAQTHKENLLKSERFCKRRRQGFLQAWHEVAGTNRCVRHAGSVVQRKSARLAACHAFDGCEPAGQPATNRNVSESDNSHFAGGPDSKCRGVDGAASRDIFLPTGLNQLQADKNNLRLSILHTSGMDPSASNF